VLKEPSVFTNKLVNAGVTNAKLATSSVAGRALGFHRRDGIHSSSDPRTVTVGLSKRWLNSTRTFVEDVGIESAFNVIAQG
jgi:hypothetical protein